MSGNQNATRRGGNNGPIACLYFYNLAIDPGAVAANAILDVNVTCTGAEVGDVVAVSPNAALEAGIVAGPYRVSAANTVTIRYGNLTAAPVDPAAHTVHVALLR